MTHIGLFEGEGGFSLAASWMGWSTLAWCEWDEFNQRVLKYHFPEAEMFGDITKSDFTKYANRIDILTGGFPCQPFSNSGEQLGEEDNRWLFDEMLRSVREIKPRWIVAENVYAIASPKFESTFEYICSSLEAEGYQVQPVIIPATAVEADHERNRVWFIAYSSSIRLSGQGKLSRRIHPAEIGNRKTSGFINAIQRDTLPFVCQSHDGLPRKLAERAIHAAGNAIIPQIAFQIFKSIESFNDSIK